MKKMKRTVAVIFVLTLILSIGIINGGANTLNTPKAGNTTKIETVSVVAEASSYKLLTTKQIAPTVRSQGTNPK